MTAIQPKRRRVPPLVGEFAALVQIVSSCEPKLSHKNLLTEELHEIPVGARLLTRDIISAQGSKIMLRFGIFFEPCQFIMTAAKKRHPFLLDSGLPS
eukprot:3336271-Amphidinium_carterae.1